LSALPAVAGETNLVLDSSNWSDLQKDYDEYKQQLEAEAKSGLAQWLSVAGKRGSPTDQLYAMGAVELLIADLQKLMATDVPRQIKARSLDMLEERVASLATGGLGALAKIPSLGLSDGIKTALGSGVDWLAPDAVDNFSNQLKLVKARIAKSMGASPQYTTVIPDRDAGLKQLMALSPDLAKACPGGSGKEGESSAAKPDNRSCCIYTKDGVQRCADYLYPSGCTSWQGTTYEVGKLCMNSGSAAKPSWACTSQAPPAHH
jgi:hypothetical protein